MIKRIVEDRRFAFADLCLVLVCGLIGMYTPLVGLWCIPILLLPWLLRLLTDSFQIKRTPQDGLIFVFLLTAAASTYSAYDQAAAIQKFFFLFLAILLYYSLVYQPEENHEVIVWLFFGLGTLIAGYFFLTHDFVNVPRDVDLINRLGVQWMRIRPLVDWLPLPSGHVAGLSLLSGSLILYRFITPRNPQHRSVTSILLVVGAAIILLAIIFTTSISVWVALLGAGGVWILWLLFQAIGFHKFKGLYPWFVLISLVGFVLAVHVLGADPSANPGKFGINDRAEVFTRSLYLLGDFPIWGGGLAAFSGLYSQYILSIPYHFFQDSYNTFLDVMIEQGILGGFALLFVYLLSIYEAAREVQATGRRINLLILFMLTFAVIHGFMQDYLYLLPGAILLFFPPALLGMFEKATDMKNRIPDSPMRSQIMGGALISVALLFLAIPASRNKLMAAWYADLGSVQLAQVHLNGFPNVGWLGLNVVPRLQPAENSLQTALLFDSQNLTAVYRLGLIHMLQRDFNSAEKYLETAYTLAPDHRGVLKTLGYCHLWQGEIDHAQQLLGTLPETREELDAYYYWWQEQGRADLSAHANALIQRIDLSIAP